MDMILSYMNENKLFAIALVLTIAYLLSRLVRPANGEVRKEDLVPSYKRFERREGERGDRRHAHALAFAGVNRRNGMRRAYA